MILCAVAPTPSYPGGEKAMKEFIADNLRQPQGGKNEEGRVFVSFFVERDGALTDLKISRSLSPACDAEALRGIKAMPRWIPGKQYMNGYGRVPERVRYNVPITFKAK